MTMLYDIFRDIVTMEIKDIYDNLNTIAKIEPNDKLYHNDKFIFIEDSYVPSIQRWYRGSSRIDTVKFIKYILTQSYFQLEKLKIHSDTESTYLHMTLLNSLKNSLKGLENLKQTYSDDAITVNSIQKNMDYINKLFE